MTEKVLFHEIVDASLINLASQKEVRFRGIRNPRFIDMCKGSELMGLWFPFAHNMSHRKTSDQQGIGNQ